MQVSDLIKVLVDRLCSEGDRREFFRMALQKLSQPTEVVSEKDLLRFAKRLFQQQKKTTSFQIEFEKLRLGIQNTHQFTRPTGIRYFLLRLSEKLSEKSDTSRVELEKTLEAAEKILKKADPQLKEFVNYFLEVSEYDLLKDILYVLINVPGSYIKLKYDSSEFGFLKSLNPQNLISSNCRLPHHLQILISYFGRIAFLFSSAKRIEESQNRSLAFQSLCEYVREELKNYQNLILFLHRENEFKRLTFSKLLHYTFETSQRMSFLAEIVENCKNSSGGHLVSICSLYSKTANSIVSEMSEKALKRVWQPLVETMRIWMTLGELRDPEHEFFVLKAAQRPDEENVWRDLFFIDRTQLPTEIPIELAKKILLTGFFF